MGSIAGSIIGAASDMVTTSAQVGAQVATNNKTNATNLQIAQETNKTNAENVAATNAANVHMNDSTNQANLAINQATNAANIAMTDKTNAANLQIAQDTNKANAEIAQMNNEYNERMLERQIQQEWEMWNAQNEYNTPQAQMQRQREAGVNPYVAANSGSISSGTAGSMSSPAAQPASGYTAQGATMVAPTLQPTSLTPGHVDAAQAQMVGVSAPDLSAMDGFRGIVGSFFDIAEKQNQVAKSREEANQLGIETKYKEMQILTQIAEAKERIKSSKAKRTLDEIAADYQGDLYSSELKQRREQTFLTQLQQGAQIVSNLSQLQWYKALPTQIKQTLNEQAVRISNMKLAGKLTAAQVRTEVSKAVDMYWQSMLAKQQYGQNDKMNPKLLSKIKAEITSIVNNQGPKDPWQVMWSNFGKKPIVGFGDKDSRTYTPGWLW